MCRHDRPSLPPVSHPTCIQLELCSGMARGCADWGAGGCGVRACKWWRAAGARAGYGDARPSKALPKPASRRDPNNKRLCAASVDAGRLGLPKSDLAEVAATDHEDDTTVPRPPPAHGQPNGIPEENKNKDAFSMILINIVEVFPNDRSRSVLDLYSPMPIHPPTAYSPPSHPPHHHDQHHNPTTPPPPAHHHTTTIPPPGI